MPENALVFWKSNKNFLKWMKQIHIKVTEELLLVAAEQRSE